MGVTYAHAADNLEESARRVFRDRAVRSMGIGRHGDGFGYFVVRNPAAIAPQGEEIALEPARAHGGEIAGVPITVRNTARELRVCVKVPYEGPGSPTLASAVVEQNRVRPLCCGLQIQNFDSDVRDGVIDEGSIIIGTLGCFVTSKDGSAALLSNNHVVAAENHGKRGADRILQAGAGKFSATQHVAVLADFERIVPSPHGATVANGKAKLNVVDAGIAKLLPKTKWSQRYHASRSLVRPHGVGAAAVGDRVFKVGRTTGLTHGEVKSVATIVGPVPYRDGASWFRRSLVIEGLDGTMFSDHGDSGSAILKADGEVVGLLYAGNGAQTFACPMEDVVKELGVTLA